MTLNGLPSERDHSVLRSVSFFPLRRVFDWSATPLLWYRHFSFQLPHRSRLDELVEQIDLDHPAYFEEDDALASSSDDDEDEPW
jgi:hypothetical protein